MNSGDSVIMTPFDNLNVMKILGGWHPSMGKLKNKRMAGMLRRE